MASTLNALSTGGGGLVSSGDASGVLALQTNGTTTMTLDTSGNVGIGTSSPTFIAGYTSLALNNGTNGSIVDLRAGGTLYSRWVATSSQANISTEAAIPLVFQTNSTERMRIDSSGNLLVGRTTTASGLGGDTPIVFANGAFCSYVGSYNAQYSSDRINFNNANYYVVNGSTVGVKLVSGSTSWTTQSDERTKTDLVPIANGLQKVNTLRAVTGRYTKDQEGVSRAFLIAQDVKAVLPEAVDEDTDEAKTLGLRYTEVIPLLVASIKELKAINDTQAAEIAELKAKVG